MPWKWGSPGRFRVTGRCKHKGPNGRGPYSARKAARTRKPIISAELKGERFVAVKSRLLHSKRWKTFHDFLLGYIKAALGIDWCKAELAKPLEQRHPVTTWYQKVYEHMRAFSKKAHEIHQAPMTGAVAAYLHLAYDLYALDHNAELQSRLLARLRNCDKFTGALYEVFVAAAFVRAGFQIEFEDEGDGSRSQCEFTATHPNTHRRFSVEVKRREGQTFNFGHLFNQALAKRADQSRVVFIDINMHAPVPEHGKMPDYLKKLCFGCVHLKVRRSTEACGQPHMCSLQTFAGWRN